MLRLNKVKNTDTAINQGGCKGASLLLVGLLLHRTLGSAVTLQGIDEYLCGGGAVRSAVQGLWRRANLCGAAAVGLGVEHVHIEDALEGNDVLLGRVTGLCDGAGVVWEVDVRLVGGKVGVGSHGAMDVSLCVCSLYCGVVSLCGVGEQRVMVDHFPVKDLLFLLGSYAADAEQVLQERALGLFEDGSFAWLEVPEI